MKDFTHYEARTAREAVDLLQKQNGRAKLNAGGTDLLGLLKDMVIDAYPKSIINIKSIPGLDYIREDKGGLKIGALAKLAAIAASPVVKERYNIIAEAAKSVATPQIRNMCTIGGNLAQEVRCWYYRYPDQLGGTVMCLRRGGPVCDALTGDNRYHSVFGGAPLASYPCASHCPSGAAIPAWLEKMKNGEWLEAARTLVETNPIPAVTGRVCPIFCEPECKRGQCDEPVAIRCVERSLGDYMLENAGAVYAAPQAESGKKAAVVGSGPSGLAAAYCLRKAGHAVVVYEKLPEAGGMLFYSIPGYRLPKDVVRRQVQALQAMGVVFKLGCEAGKDVSLQDLAARFDAVLAACGTWKERAQTIKGDAPLLSGLDFLKGINEGDRRLPGKRVAVIGGGNVAVDVARTLARLGAKAVVLYRRSRKEMPALKEEVSKAVEEGVVFRFLTLPVEASKTGGKISLTCVKMRLGAPDASGRRQAEPKAASGFNAVFDAVISAIGEEADRECLPSSLKNKAAGGESGHLLGRNIYMAGDFMNGASTVIEAVASGREAACLINRALGGADLAKTDPVGLAFPGGDAAARLVAPELPVSERALRLDREDVRGVSAEEAQREAGRCFNCGCLAVNPSDIGVALVAADGVIVTTKRSIRASEFFAPDAATATVLDDDEMITEVRVPPLPATARQGYAKFTLRKPVDFAIVSVASVIGVKDGVCSDARIALGAVAPAPVRADTAERMLVGKPLTEQAAAQAAEAALKGAHALSRNGYKLQIAKTLIERAILGASAG